MPFRTPDEQANFDLIWHVFDSVAPRMHSGGPTVLTNAERTLWVVMSLEAEVLNGGFDQYFFNDAGALAGEAAEAFRRVGADRAGSIVGRAVATFPLPGPSALRKERCRQLERLSDTQKAELASLTHAFYEYPDPLEVLLASYVKQHRSELAADHDGAT